MLKCSDCRPSFSINNNDTYSHYCSHTYLADRLLLYPYPSIPLAKRAKRGGPSTVHYNNALAPLEPLKEKPRHKFGGSFLNFSIPSSLTIDRRIKQVSVSHIFTVNCVNSCSEANQPFSCSLHFVPITHPINTPHLTATKSLHPHYKTCLLLPQSSRYVLVSNTYLLDIAD